MIGVLLAVAASVALVGGQVLPCPSDFFKNIETGPNYGSPIFQDFLNVPANPGAASSLVVRYPPNGGTLPVPINGMQILDEVGDGSGGCAKVVYGGVGYGFVIVQYVSHVGKAMEYKVTLFGSLSNQG